MTTSQQVLERRYKAYKLERKQLKAAMKTIKKQLKPKTQND